MREGSSQADRSFTIVKVGGSLYDLPRLGPRLSVWLRASVEPKVLLVPGGGSTADLVREWDRCQHLGETAAHWLALRALAFNAQLLAALIPGAGIVTHPAECSALWRREQIPLLDVHAFAVADEAEPDHLPHSWEATSDSFALRVARVAGASQLVLLKSVTVPQSMTWEEAGQQGHVDRLFARLAQNLPDLVVRCVNFRAVREDVST